MKLRDRAEAGRLLAARLRHLRGEDPVVLALPRGGVPVALPIAEALGAALDLLLVRKIGAPHYPELAVGAVVEGTPPQTVVNDDIVAALGLAPTDVSRGAARQVTEIARRRQLWFQGREPVPTAGRNVIVVDDGIATGATVRAALLGLERAGARRRILAAPVVQRDTGEQLRRLCDEAVFLTEPEELGSVSLHYEDFRQLEDAEVMALLKTAAATRAATGR